MGSVKETSEDKAKRIWATITKARDDFSERREEVQENYAFFASDQWSQEDKSMLEEQERVPVVFNRIARTINAVCGLEIQNRQEVRFIPRVMGEAGVSELLTGAAKWVRDNCDAEDEESDAFGDLIISGTGWTETRMDYETDPDGLVVIDRIDPMEMLWDNSAKKRNIADSRWRARVKQFSKSEVDERWPDAELTASYFWMDENSSPHNATDAWKYKNNQGPKDSATKYTVVQYQYYVLEDVYRIASPDGNIVDMPADRWGKVKSQFPDIKAVKIKQRKYKQIFISGEKILEEGDCPCSHDFTLKCMTGMRDRNNGTWFGLVDLMKDPQRWANKWLSQIMHILNTNAKGGLLAEQGAFVNPRKAEEDWANPSSITFLNAGGLEKIMPKPMGQYPNGIDKLLTYALESIDDVPGVNKELMGLADRAQVGYLEAQRKNAGVTMLATFFDALRRYRKEQGRVLAYFIREYISDGRLIKIVSQGQAQYIPLIKNDDAMEYDVIVDDAPTSPNMKEKVFSILTQLLPQLIEMGMPPPAEFLDYSPLPEELVQKWKEQMQQPNPVQEQTQQIQLAQGAADVQLTQAKTAATEAQANVAVIKAQPQPQQQDPNAHWDTMAKLSGADAQMYNAQTQRMKANTEQFRAVVDAQTPDKGQL